MTDESEQAAREWLGDWKYNAVDLWHNSEFRRLEARDVFAICCAKGQAHGEKRERERTIAWWQEKTKQEFWTARDLLVEFLKEKQA